jgi:hypothetical protein
MPKNPVPGKKTGARNATSAGPRAVPAAAAPSRGRPLGRRRHAPHSVKQLLGGGSLRGAAGALRDLQHTRPQAQEWVGWLRERLPAELAAHLNAVVCRALPAMRAAQLVLFADSALWCARLRYALGTLEGQIRAHDAAITSIQVRVRLRGPDAPA